MVILMGLMCSGCFTGRTAGALDNLDELLDCQKTIAKCYRSMDTTETDEFKIYKNLAHCLIGWAASECLDLLDKIEG